MTMNRSLLALAAVCGTGILALAACASPRRTAGASSPVTQPTAATASATTPAAVPATVPAVCQQAQQAGILIAAGATSINQPSRATIRGWLGKLGPILRAGARARARAFSSSSGVTVAEANTMDDAIIKLGIYLYPVVDTGYGGSPPLPVSSVNWGDVDTQAVNLESACAS